MILADVTATALALRLVKERVNHLLGARDYAEAMRHVVALDALVCEMIRAEDAARTRT